jgi:hypothetical protein
MKTSLQTDIMSIEIKWAELMFQPALLIRAVLTQGLLKLILPEQLQNVSHNLL